jgi:hypothetical protein
MQLRVGAGQRVTLGAPLTGVCFEGARVRRKRRRGETIRSGSSRRRRHSPTESPRDSREYALRDSPGSRCGVNGCSAVVFGLAAIIDLDRPAGSG